MNSLVMISRSGRFAALLATAWIGCAKVDGPAETAEPVAARSVVERGPVRLTVEVTPGQPRLSDEPRLTLMIEAAAGVRIETPPFGDAVGDFLIRDFHEPLPASTDDGRQIIRQVYTMEPTRAGSLTIAPIAVHFQDGRPQGDGQRHTIESDAVKVEVSTILLDEAPSLAQLRPATGPLELKSSNRSAVWWILSGLAMTAAAVFVIWRRRRAIATEPVLTPRELAWRELDQLTAQRLADTDVKLYYVQLTGIVRRFIERSTGIRAPEQTTEEFLREIAGHDRFASDEQRRLREFLEAADLVKFAGFQPHPHDVEESFERARRFIGHEQDALREMSV